MTSKELKPLKNIPERWKRYKNTDYYISDQGRVSHRYKNGKEYECGWFDKRHRNHQMVAKINGKDKKISKLVYETFIGQVPKGKAIIHKNGLKKDNSIYNLKVVDPKVCGEKYGYKSKNQYVYCKDNKTIYRSAREVSKHLPISRQTVTDICNGKVKKPCMNMYWYDEEKEEIYRGKYRNENN